MGMYDSISIDRLYCPFCGKPILNSDWQTKSGERKLKTYQNLNEFGDDNYKLYYFNIYTTCDSCNEWVELNVTNKSEEHLHFSERQAKKLNDDLIERCTKDHPNHSVQGNSGYKPCFWNCWCSICKDKGYERDVPNPDMDPTYLKIHEDKVKQDYLMQIPKEERIEFEKLINNQGWEVAVEYRRKKALESLRNIWDDLIDK